MLPYHKYFIRSYYFAITFFKPGQTMWSVCAFNVDKPSILGKLVFGIRAQMGFKVSNCTNIVSF